MRQALWFGRQRDGDRDRHGVDEEVGERHAGQRHDQRGRLGVGRAAEAHEDLAGRLHGQHQHRHVEQRAVHRVRRPRVQRRLAPAAGGADDHRRVRPAQDQRGDVDDVRHRHVRAAGDRELDLEGRGQRREQDEEEQRDDRRERGARNERGERQRAQRDDRDDVPAAAGRQIPEQNAVSIALDNVQTSVLYICLRRRLCREKPRVVLLVLVLAAGAGAYAYRRMAPAALVLTGIVTTNDVIVSPQIAGQIGQLLVDGGDIGQEGSAGRGHHARRAEGRHRLLRAQRRGHVVAGARVGGGAPAAGAADRRSDPPGRVDAGLDRGAGRSGRRRPRAGAADLHADAEPVARRRRLAAGARSGAHRADGARRPSSTR